MQGCASALDYGDRDYDGSAQYCVDSAQLNRGSNASPIASPPSALRAATSPFRGGFAGVTGRDQPMACPNAAGRKSSPRNLRRPGLDPGFGFPFPHGPRKDSQAPHQGAGRRWRRIALLVPHQPTVSADLFASARKPSIPPRNGEVAPKGSEGPGSA